MFKFFSVLLNKKPTLILLKNFSTGRGTKMNKEFEKDIKEYKKAKNETMKSHRMEFWEEHTKTENLWLEEFLKTGREKKQLDDAKHRNSIIKNSFICYNEMVKLPNYIF